MGSLDSAVERDDLLTADITWSYPLSTENTHQHQHQTLEL